MKHKPKEILEAAAIQFASKGYCGVSTIDIAEQGEVTQPLIHYYFETKENLFFATIAYLYEKNSASGSNLLVRILLPEIIQNSERLEKIDQEFQWFKAYKKMFKNTLNKEFGI